MKNVEERHEKWCAAFGQRLSRRDYFDYLLRLEETGAAVKEVVVYMRRKLSGAS